MKSTSLKCTKKSRTEEFYSRLHRTVSADWLWPWSTVEYKTLKIIWKISLDETIVHSERVNLNINPTNRLNKLTQHVQNLLESDFSGWSGKDRISSNFDRLNEKMLSAYNRCGGGADANDGDDKKSGKGELS